MNRLDKIAELNRMAKNNLTDTTIKGELKLAIASAVLSPYSPSTMYARIEAAWDITEGGGLPYPDMYDRVIMYGGRTTLNAFNALAGDVDFANLLSDYNMSPEVVIAGIDGAGYAELNTTLTPQVIADNPVGATTLVMFELSSVFVTTSYYDADSAAKSSLTWGLRDLFGGISGNGWDYVSSNLDAITSIDTESWGIAGLDVISEDNSRSYTDESNSRLLQEINELTLFHNKVLANKALTALRPFVGERIYRQKTAHSLAVIMGKNKAVPLAGKRAVVSAGGVNLASWQPEFGITPLTHEHDSPPTGEAVYGTAHIKDADDGDILEGLMVIVNGVTQFSKYVGRGDIPNETSTIYNQHIVFHQMIFDTTRAFEIVITTIDGRPLPTATVTLGGSRNASDTVRRTDWTAGGVTKILDASLIPIGVAEFQNLVPVDNKIVITGAITDNTGYGYLHALDIAFN